MDAVVHRRESGLGFALVLGIPLAAAAITWLVLDVPPGTSCYDDATAAAAAFADQAIAVSAIAAVSLMAAVAWLSASLRPERRPGRPTSIALGAAAIYLIVCLVDHAVFLPLALLGLFAVAFGFVGPPIIFVAIGVIVAAYWGLTRMAVMALGWLVLLFALPANLVMASLYAYGPLNC